MPCRDQTEEDKPQSHYFPCLRNLALHPDDSQHFQSGSTLTTEVWAPPHKIEAPPHGKYKVNAEAAFFV